MTSDASISPHIGTSRERLAQLQADLDAGRLTQESFDEQRRQVAAGLLDTAAELPAVKPARLPLAPRAIAGALVVVAVVVGLVVVLNRTPESPSESSSPNAGAPVPQTPEKPVRALTDEQLERMVEQARAQTQKDPKDVTSWAMLAHSYDMLGKFAESAKAYEELVKLAPKDAQVLADYADALAVAHGRSLEGEPSKLVDKALTIDPKNLKALSLAGTAAFERQDYAQAIALWDRARAVSTDPQFTLQIESGINEARALAKGESVSATAASAVAAAPGVAFVAGRVSLADDLAKKAPPDATVFVFARPAQGSRMPVALLRKQVRDLPLDFKLDDSMSMVPDVKLSQVPTVIIGARVSMRGDVMPQPGDMQGWSAPVNVGTKGIKLEISEVLK